ncbi:hypothetical protein PI124_g4589 [Phytophthora idaei]|nr:hypothetical protein PI125_g3684 [Phytophthora idaei]KAG3166473.1 hypothetical protein PI126_g4165 [Phytophthora idaei]KAG3250776.1 hypothetical protein PI124_g4589 [Phytophthora idaei]
MEGLYSFLLLRESAIVSQEDAESVLLFDTVQPERPIIPDVRFYLTALTDADSELLFRFSVDGVLSLCRGFALPEHVVTEDRDKMHFSEAVCILLCRLSYPKRLYDMMKLFGRSQGNSAI